VTHHRAFCPHCGFDIAPIQPVIINDFSMIAEGSPLLFRGQSVRLTSSESSMCWSLMRAFPGAVRIDVLLDRMGSDGGPEGIQVFVHRVRKKLKAIGAPDPFEPARDMHQRAYRWTTKEGSNAVDEEDVSAEELYTRTLLAALDQGSRVPVTGAPDPTTGAPNLSG
jgi:hypothetical protein